MELAVWTHSVANDVKPELLKDMPDLDKLQHAVIGGTNGTTTHNPTSDNSITTTETTTIVESNTEPSDESAGENNENNHNNKNNENEQKEIVKQKPANGEFLTVFWDFE